MPKIVNIALIGDYNASVTAHQAIPKALNIAARVNQVNVEFEWLDTAGLVGNISETLAGYQGIWCVPASPYENMDAALTAIRYAREAQLPFLGTCGGYQHAILEYAKNVLNLGDADNAEVNPDTPFPLISQLVCALVEQSGEINLLENSRINAIYNQKIINEKYHCSYGFNRDYLNLFDGSDLLISGLDAQDDPRVIELVNHRFFIGTAFQPERSSLNGNTHPLINQFILETLGADS